MNFVITVRAENVRDLGLGRRMTCRVGSRAPGLANINFESFYTPRRRSGILMSQLESQLLMEILTYLILRRFLEEVGLCLHSCFILFYRKYLFERTSRITHI